MEIVENAPEEIEALVLEMHQRLRSEFESSKEDDEMQTRFMSVIEDYPDVIRFYGGQQNLVTISTKFLRRHSELLD